MAITKSKTTKTSHNRFGIVERFAFTSSNHPWISKDASDKNIAHVSIPLEDVQSITELNVLLPYEDEAKQAKGGVNGMLERWLQKRFLQNVVEGDTHLTFTCSMGYLAGKLFAKGK